MKAFTRSGAVFAILVTVGAIALAQSATANAQAKPPAPTITLATKPSPPAAGETVFTVTVKASDGKPVAGP